MRDSEIRFFDNQKSFVATNNSSIIEAYIEITENNHVFTFGLYKDDKPIFLNDR